MAETNEAARRMGCLRTQTSGFDAVQQPFVASGSDMPEQGVGETLEAGAVTNGLSPGMPSSVAPSGMALPAPADPDVVDADAPAPEAPLDPPEPQSVPGVEFDTDPPPSKVELDPAVPPVVVAAPEHVAAPAGGLSPPIFSSVAPRGISAGDGDPAEFGEPSGDVTPIPDPGSTCATLGWQPMHSTHATMVRTRRIEASVQQAKPDGETPRNPLRLHKLFVMRVSSCAPI
jgi:hypothetical protein